MSGGQFRSWEFSLKIAELKLSWKQLKLSVLIVKKLYRFYKIFFTNIQLYFLNGLKFKIPTHKYTWVSKPASCSFQAEVGVGVAEVWRLFSEDHHVIRIIVLQHLIVIFFAASAPKKLKRHDCCWHVRSY